MQTDTQTKDKPASLADAAGSASDAPECVSCRTVIDLRPGTEHDGLCDSCAHDEVARLRDGIDRAVNALTDSILCSGNDAQTNLHFVRKLKTLLQPNIRHEPQPPKNSNPSA